MKKRMMECAYCRCVGRASIEHAMPRWMFPYTRRHVSVTPARGKHLWAGPPTLRDVCQRCNNGVLSRLDKLAHKIVERSMRASPTMTEVEAVDLARWAGKMAFNMQRVCFKESTQGQETMLPTEAVKWIVGGTPTDKIGVCGAWVGTGDCVRENFGVFGSNGTALPRRVVQAGPVVLFVGWEHPQVTGSARQVVEFDCARAPARDLLEAKEPSLRLPVMTSTDTLIKGLASMPEVARELVARLERVERQ